MSEYDYRKLDSENRFMSNVVAVCISESKRDLTATDLSDMGKAAAQCLTAARLELGKEDNTLANQYIYRIEQLSKAEDAAGMYELSLEIDDSTWFLMKRIGIPNFVLGQYRKLQYQGYKAQLENE